MTQKNHFLITHFNFKYKIPLKMNDIKKIIHLNFIKEIPKKMNRTKKNKKLRIFLKRPHKLGEFEDRLLVWFQKYPT